MDFSMTDEQKLLLESLQDVIERYLPESAVRQADIDGTYLEDFMPHWREAGFPLLGMPERLGGTPCDVTTLMLFQMEVNRLTSAGYVLGTNALSIDDMIEFGSEQQFQDTANSIKAGRNPFCLGITEPQAGSDDSAIATTFVRRDGKVYINGHKTFISGARDADHMLCMAIDPDCDDPRKKVSTWWIDMKKPGITLEPIDKIGWHLISSSEVYLDDVECEESDLVGREGYGFMNVMKNFEVERLMLAANCAGQARLAYEDALEYATQRVQFNKTIGQFQLVQEMLTDMYAKCENMYNMVLKCAWRKDQGESINTDAAVAKRYCAMASFEVIDDALQIFGGLGYSEDNRIARVWRSNRVNRIAGGTDQIMVHIAGRALQREFTKGK